jgi:hypothetical protein
MRLPARVARVPNDLQLWKLPRSRPGLARRPSGRPGLYRIRRSRVFTKTVSCIPPRTAASTARRPWPAAGSDRHTRPPQVRHRGSLPARRHVPGSACIERRRRPWRPAPPGRPPPPVRRQPRHPEILRDLPVAGPASIISAAGQPYLLPAGPLRRVQAAAIGIPHP